MLLAVTSRAIVESSLALFSLLLLHRHKASVNERGGRTEIKHLKASENDSCGLYFLFPIFFMLSRVHLGI